MSSSTPVPRNFIRWFEKYRRLFAATFRLKIAALFCLASGPCVGLAATPLYTPPVTHRVDVSLDDNWRFIREDAPGATEPGFDDAKWGTVTLPHTWNNLDGQDGGNNYYRGPG